jgi:hypothetical protein
MPSPLIHVAKPPPAKVEKLSLICDEAQALPFKVAGIGN